MNHWCLTSHHFLLISLWPSSAVPCPTQMPLQPCPTGEGGPGMSSRLPELTQKAALLLIALPALHAGAFGSPSFPRLMKTRGWEMKLTPEAPHKFEINAHLNVHKNNLMLTRQEQLNSHTSYTQWYFVWGVGELRQVAVMTGGTSKHRESTQSYPNTQDVVFFLYKDLTQLSCPLWNISSFLSYFLCILREHAALDP